MCVCVERESVYDFNVRMYVYDMCTCVRMHVHISYYTIHMKHVCFAVCFRMLQSIVLCCSVMQCVVVCCSVSRTMYLVLQCVAVCCSVLQCLYRHHGSITALGRKSLAHSHCRNACQHITPYNKRWCIYVYMCTLNV